MKSMDERKIAFIICANDEMELEECQYYLSRLSVPEGMTTEVLFIWDAQSITSGYQEGMSSTDAKYKVYLHQDTFIINQNFLFDMLAVFQGNLEIGMIGCVGASKWRIEEGYLPVNSYDTGKVFHNLRDSYLDYGSPQGRHLKVAMVDGLVMATQTDVPWREDLFQGWHLYDASQSMEIQRSGKDVVVPFQKTPWCYHDAEAANMEDYHKYYELFLKEYFPKIQYSNISNDENILELHRKLEKLKKMLDNLIEKGEREAFLNICQNPELEKIGDLGEYLVIASIELAEMQELTVRKLWCDGLQKNEILVKIRVLKHLIKRLEYDAEEGIECSYLQENYSIAAVKTVIRKYVWNSKKVMDKLSLI